MKSIDVSIAFLFDYEELCLPSSDIKYTDVSFSCPETSLPNIGDIISIDGIQSPTGDLIVRRRAFEVQRDKLCGVTLYLDIEDILTILTNYMFS